MNKTIDIYSIKKCYYDDVDCSEEIKTYLLTGYKFGSLLSVITPICNNHLIIAKRNYLKRKEINEKVVERAKKRELVLYIKRKLADSAEFIVTKGLDSESMLSFFKGKIEEQIIKEIVE